MTGILPMGRLLVSVCKISCHASTDPPGHVYQTDSLKRKSRLNPHFLEKTKLKEINSSEKQPGSRPGTRTLDEPAAYEFRVAANVSDQWAAWFEDLDLARDDQGNTLLTGTITDQAALHGVLIKIRDLNLILLSVRRK
jgi:hypothetical protein